ncbi:MAG: S-layer protein [Cyanobacteria bacterium QH_10_48_56]|nr:MAG: S-layer protein [Cyanobacteria bacterium QH_10_48_56]
MLPHRHSAIRYTLLASLLGLLSACSNGQALESWFAADPKLQENPASSKSSPEKPSNQKQAQLPDNFPQEIPLYPKAQLVEAQPGQARWKSRDRDEAIASFYQQEFQSHNWEMVAPSSQAKENGDNALVARRGELQVKVSFSSSKSLSPTSSSSGNAGKATEFALQYQRNPNFAHSETKKSQESNQTPIASQELKELLLSGESQQTPIASPNTSEPNQEAEKKEPNQTKPTATTSTSTAKFSDLEQVPEQRRKYIQDLATLGVFNATSDNQNKSAASENKFAPYETITRREFARWLVAANNQIYANQPGKRVRPVSEASQPAFQDVSKNDPGFAAIQGLAEAGLIPSRLSGDETAVLFRPNAPLTRKDLIAWKVPLDTRQSLPEASVKAVNETWGFQDTAQIKPEALRAVLADFSAGEQANIRRVFAYTRLFQPDKPVTREEAAAALWYFGSQGEGMSAEEASKMEAPSSQGKDQG